jgi:hypothetical protein
LIGSEALALVDPLDEEAARRKRDEACLVFLEEPALLLGKQLVNVANFLVPILASLF